MLTRSRVSAGAAPDAIGVAGRGVRRVVIALLIVSGLLTLAYSAISIYAASALVYVPQVAIAQTPAKYGLAYKDIQFPAREDGVMIHGWFIPAVIADPTGTHLSADRTIIVVHGTRQNRTDLAMGLLDLSADLVHHGFAVLSFDMRGMGESPPAPISFGEFEQRDVLGAVDFLRASAAPYPGLGKPRVIGGWGVSMGGATLLLAAAREPAIAAIVSDSAYADILPILEREVPKQGGVPAFLVPGTLLAARALFGVNYYDVRPIDVVARLAPRPLLLIHGSADHYVPPANQDALFAAATRPANANVSYWRVDGADHAQAYHKAGQAYVDRVTEFFTTYLGADQSPA